MILADSSAWIDFIKKPNVGVGATLRELLAADSVLMAGPVLAEVLRGLDDDEVEFRNTLDAVPFADTTKETWMRTGLLARTLETSGKRIPFVDILIAAMTLEGDHQLLTRDSHFDRIPNLRLYDWKDASDA